MQTLDLFLHEQFVGEVRQDPADNRRVQLNVDPGYANDVVLSESLTLLPGRRPSSHALSHFLGGYLPEGRQRDAIAVRGRTTENNLFALLNQVGGSLAGAISLRSYENHGAEVPVPVVDGELQTDKMLARQLKSSLEQGNQCLPSSRTALAGTGPTLLATLEGKYWALPVGDSPSSHILKPQRYDRPHRIYDEHYTHLLTQHMGLSRFSSEIHWAENLPYLAIERYDRIPVEGGIELVHQEDLAQALNLDWQYPDVKFEKAGWPEKPQRASASAIAKLISVIPAGDSAVHEWLRHLTFHIAIGNSNAHAKNVSLIHRKSGTEFAQMYDAQPTLFHEHAHVTEMALAVNGEFSHHRMSMAEIVAEAVSWGVMTEASAISTVTTTLTQFEAALSAVRAPAGVSAGLVEALQWNMHRLLSGSEIGTWSGARSRDLVS